MSAILDIDCLADCSSYGYTALPNTLGCHMVCVTQVNGLSWFVDNGQSNTATFLTCKLLFLFSMSNTV
jgi:hypothetical protein